MSLYSSPEDLPPYDPNAYDTERIARAEEFQMQVKRLWRPISKKVSDPTDISTVAQYELAGPAGTTLLAVHTDEYVSQATVIFPPLHIITNGIFRRLTSRRKYELRHDDVSILKDTADIPDTSEELTPEEAEVDRVFDYLITRKLEEKIDPNYRPSELIWAYNHPLIEQELPRGLGFRYERPPDNPHEAQLFLGYFSQVRAYNLSMSPNLYNLTEHGAVMGLLHSVIPKQRPPSIETSELR